MKRILVTGATGFIGNSLVERLIKMGYEVIPVGRTLKPWSSDFIRENLLKIDLITEKTIEYLSGQIEAGAEVIQLFDSWSGMLNGIQYDDFIISPTCKIVSSLKEKYADVPIIGFPRGSGYNYKKYIELTGIDGVGVDQFIPLAEMKKWQKNIVVQGNLDPVILLGSKENITYSVDEILSECTI